MVFVVVFIFALFSNLELAECAGPAGVEAPEVILATIEENFVGRRDGLIGRGRAPPLPRGSIARPYGNGEGARMGRVLYHSCFGSGRLLRFLGGPGE